MKIIFMGTPEFAVPCLEILLEHGYEVVGVVTSTDKYGGRGKKKLLESAVKRAAMKHGLNILQPPRLKRQAFIDELQALNADLQVVVAFRMLPEVVWNMPPLGSINLHGSLLPRYRGAAPINWAVINGDNETGLTTFKLKHEIDTGDLIHQVSTKIGPNETAGDVHDRLMLLGAKLVLKTVQDIEHDRVIEQTQDESSVSHAPKLFHENCQIDFNQSTQTVHNFIRGLSPYPSAWTTVDSLQLNVIKSEIVFDHEENHVENHVESYVFQPGKFDLRHKGEWRIDCVDGQIKLLVAQLQGRKRMKVKDLLNGFQPQSSEVTYDR